MKRENKEFILRMWVAISVMSGCIDPDLFPTFRSYLVYIGAVFLNIIVSSVLCIRYTKDNTK